MMIRFWKMQLVILGFMVLAALAGCLRPIGDSDPGPSVLSPAYDWAVFVYQGGDNSLTGGLNGDLVEMANATVGARIAVVVQNDSPEEGILRYRLGNGRVEDLGSLGRGDSATATRVAEFLGWGLRRYPARRVALIFGSHGHGWRRGSRRISLLEPVRGAIVTDDEYKSEIDLPPLRQALEKTLAETAAELPWLGRLDLLGFDACLMGMMETTWELKDCARFLTFSQANTPTNGWPYHLWLTALASDAVEVDGGGLGRLIGETFRIEYTSGTNAGISGTLSTIDTAKFPALATAFAGFAGVLEARSGTTAAGLVALRDARKTAPGLLFPGEGFVLQAFDLSDFRDLDDLASGVAKLAPEFVAPAGDLRSALAAAVVARVQFGTRYLRSAGLSVAFPGANESASYLASGVIPLYRDLALASETRWDELVESLLAASAGVGLAAGRRFSCTLTWNTAADLDLVIGEPDPLAPNDPARATWNQAALQPVTRNGFFSGDSRQTGVASETWSASATLQPGRYWVVVSSHWRSAVDATTTPRLILGGEAGNTPAVALDGPPLRAGNRWEAGFFEVGTASLTASLTGP